MEGRDLVILRLIPITRLWTLRWFGIWSYTQNRLYICNLLLLFLYFSLHRLLEARHIRNLLPLQILSQINTLKIWGFILHLVHRQLPGTYLSGFYFCQWFVHFFDVHGSYSFFDIIIPRCLIGFSRDQGWTVSWDLSTWFHQSWRCGCGISWRVSSSLVNVLIFGIEI